MKQNKWHPLPPDYGQLTADGQRQARKAVLCDQSTPEKLVQAWDLFRRWYLRPMGDNFYKGGFVESPPFHYQAVRDLGTYARNALGAPRGTAKSTVIGCEIPLLFFVTRPNYEVMLGLATDRLVEERFDKIGSQICENPYIIDDFGVLRPKRGRTVWNKHHMHGTNGSVLKGISVMGKKRGGRPGLFLLDDPENDPDSEAQQTSDVLIEKFEMILFRQIIPMLAPGCGIFWIGTLINRRCFLYHATMGDDPRFHYWNRRVLEAISDDGKKLLWSNLWTKEALDARKEEIGQAAFSAEYLNKPVSATDRILHIDELRNEYFVEEDPREAPFNCKAKVRWHEVDHGKSLETNKNVFVDREETFNEFVGPMFRLGVFDYAYGLNSYNDYSCLGIFGFDKFNTLWILDMWMGRAKEATLLKVIYETCKRWDTRVIGIESASVQISFADSVSEHVAKYADQEGWRPRVIPIKYPPNVKKEHRIASLEWRFMPGRIKYPGYLRDQWPFKQLYMQTEDFTHDLALLVHDDAIDTVSMTQYIVHAKGIKLPKPQPEMTLERRIRQNESIVPGLPVLSGVDIGQLKPEEMSALLDKQYLSRYNKPIDIRERKGHARRDRRPFGRLR